LTNAMKLPVLVETVVGFVASVTPSNEMKIWFPVITKKPVPVTWTAVPAGPLVTLRLAMLGVPTVMVDVAELPAASVITSVLAPAATVTGMKNVGLAVPAGAVVAPPVRVTATPLRVAVNALDAAKPVAVMVIAVPFSMPAVGAVVIFGSTVNVVLDVSAGAENAIVTVFAPATLEGTTTGMPMTAVFVTVFVHPSVPFA